MITAFSTVFWRRRILSIWIIVGLSLSVGASADLVTSFQGLTLDPNLHLDVPDSSVGTITLDTVGHSLQFTGSGADLWDSRNGLPYAWTAIPTLAVGQTWRAETEVQFLDPWNDGVSGRIAGLTIYSGPEGSGGGNDGQPFTFGLDHWDWPNGIEVQGLGGANGHLGFTHQPFDTQIVDLRMDVTVGVGNNNDYGFSYKLPTDTDWISLGSIQSVNSADRVALFEKGNPLDVEFNYFNVTEITTVPEPSSFAMLSIGGLLLGGYAWRKRRRKVVGL